MALPPPPADYDPLDPKNLKLDELIEKYNQFRKENGELAKKLEETEKALNELQSSQADIEALRKENDQIKAEMEAQKTRYKEELKKQRSFWYKLIKKDLRNFMKR